MTEVAATEVQRTQHAIVFLTSEWLVEAASNWSKPMQAKFEKDAHGHWQLVMREVPPDWERQMEEEPRHAA